MTNLKDEDDSRSNRYRTSEPQFWRLIFFSHLKIIRSYPSRWKDLTNFRRFVWCVFWTCCFGGVSKTWSPWNCAAASVVVCGIPNSSENYSKYSVLCYTSYVMGYLNFKFRFFFHHTFINKTDSVATFVPLFYWVPLRFSFVPSPRHVSPWSPYLTELEWINWGDLSMEFLKCCSNFTWALSWGEKVCSKMGMWLFTFNDKKF